MAIPNVPISGIIPPRSGSDAGASATAPRLIRGPISGTQSGSQLGVQPGAQSGISMPGKAGPAAPQTNTGWLEAWHDQSSRNWEVPDTSDQAAGTGSGDWGKDGFGLNDFIDTINPLQHIPVVSTLYRSLTGDQITPAAPSMADRLV